VTIPAHAALGAHRIAVYASDGALIGWAGTTVTAAPEGAAAAGPDRLPDTGGEAAVGVFAAALLLLAAGGGLVFASRRRSAAHHA
jgi:LPXTG-motif cell wall-anchored protein